MDERLLRPNDVAARLQVSRAKAYQLLATDIRTVRIGRVVRVTEQDLREYIERNRSAA